MPRAPNERLSLEDAAGTRDEIDRMQEFMHRCGAREPAHRLTMDYIAPEIEVMFRVCA